MGWSETLSYWVYFPKVCFPEVYLSKEFFCCEMYPTCVSSKLCKFIFGMWVVLTKFCEVHFLISCVTPSKVWIDPSFYGWHWQVSEPRGWTLGNRLPLLPDLNLYNWYVANCYCLPMVGLAFRFLSTSTQPEDKLGEQNLFNKCGLRTGIKETLTSGISAQKT